jgi:uroporphyrinogen decarboxylase
VVFDLQIEAEKFGREVLGAEDAPPAVRTHPLADTTSVPCLCTLPTEKDGRLPMVLDVTRRLKAKVGESTALYGLICGPFTLASHLRGSEIFMGYVR